ncbi:carbohydrate binding family 9 domain-containing protein [Muriicola sp. Z0-33]|uniref:carbohydrate binding family 9 domain-containing protein n=1 Tax=Muriicola sp. Z0-33 TaxID=2816957 RepID=UPI0022374230|nr:carbohydrate binding family 9 domain-containing protein [Muriicola sp. Z0-33]MCW5518112.1 carbohydrate binding family 9 domain-containing protein [Muriicola sp. Z0-33]
MILFNRNRFFTIMVIVLITARLFSQESIPTFYNKEYKIKPATTLIEIDGIDDNNEWSNYDAIQNLYNHYPVDSGKAKRVTLIKLTYDDKNLYVQVKCYDNGKRFIQSVALDNSRAHWDSDSFTMTIDPINQGQNGYMFGVNVGGAKIESSLSNNGAETIYSEAWDSKWDSSVKQYKDYWIAEISIPFSSLRFNNESRDWGINFIRNDMFTNYDYTWTSFPVNYGSMDLNFMGTLHWSEDVPKNGRFFSLAPYATFSSIKHTDVTNPINSSKIKVGIDSKINVSSSLNLDLTLNPDFSNADTDEEITNVSRFDIFLPERRNFFIENNDIFSNFGSELVRPFYSRNIGINNGDLVPISFGAKITGNLMKNTRIGIMNVQTSKMDDILIENYTVSALHQKVFKKSVLKIFYINKHLLNNVQKQYMNNFGTEFNFISKSQNFNNTIKFHSVKTEEKLSENHYYGFSGNYNTRSFRSGWNVEVVGKNYVPELGINPRIENYNVITGETFKLGYTHIHSKLQHLLFSKTPKSKLNWHGIRTWHHLYFNTIGEKLTEQDNSVAWDFSFVNTSSFSIDYNFRKVKLPYSTNILGGDFILPEGEYNFNQYGISYETDNRRIIKSNIRIGYGGFFDGTRLSLDFNENFRIKSWGNFSLSYNCNFVNDIANGINKKIHLLKFRSDISFTNNLFLNTVVQKNTQNNNLAIYTRLQWRFLPMSDLYVIFNNNYNSENYNLKSKSVILKLTYWF